MKKLLSLISALTLGTTTSLTVIACGNSNSQESIEMQNVKKLSNQTSNVAKAFLLGKNENFNTNRLLHNALKDNEHNIRVKGNESTGSSYEEFKKVWGYQYNIDGVTAEDFNDNSASTIDNNLKETKQQIEGIFEEINSTFNMIKSLENPFTNQNVRNLLIIARGLGLPETLFNLNQNPELIETIKEYIPLIQEIFGNIGAFDPKATLGEEYYKEDDIAGSVLGENNDGWFYSLKSEAVSKESSILESKNFQNWDQVALFKSSVDLNGLFYQLSGNQLTLGDMFDEAIIYDQGKAVNFDINIFIEKIGSILSTATVADIINLVSTLIPIIKYQVFGIVPTTAVTKISTKEKTDSENGILNLTDLISTIEKIILTKDGFTNFITDIFFPKAEKEYSLSNYATLDFTIGNQPLADIILPIKSQIVTNLENFYTNIIEPIMKNAYVQDICNRIKEIIGELKDNEGEKDDEQFTLNLTHVSQILSGADDIVKLLEKISTYETVEALKDDWMGLWAVLGLQDNPTELEFIENSFFAKIKTVIDSGDKIITNIGNILSFANKIIPEAFDILINKQPTTNLDFNNESLWSVDETTITFDYNEVFDETTIVYNLTDKVNAKTYTVSVVIEGNINQKLEADETREIWLKSLKQI